MFKDLFLLIGTNPLPNFVVAQYFIENYGVKEIYFIYSEDNKYQTGTKKYAENIREILQEKYANRNIKFYFIPLSDISFPSKIKADMRKHLADKISFLNNSHCNYTGGTKAMGVHVYEFLRENLKEKISFSYLDARTFRIISDTDDLKKGDLREEIVININDLVRLHGFEKISESYYREEFNDAVLFFENLIENNQLDRYFEDYDREKFLNAEGGLITKLKEISDALKNFAAQGTLLELMRVMPSQYKLFNDDGSFVQPNNNGQLKKAVKFIDGGWLDIYIYKLLKDCFKENKRVNVNGNVTFRKINEEENNREFEIDVLMINGYQLIGFSCTTSKNRSLCKSKGFEIFMRTRQIGGEESKAVLVTMLDREKATELERELQIDTGSGKSLVVLGKEDLKAESISYRILDIIRHNF